MKIVEGLKWNFVKSIGNFLIKFIYGVVVAKLLGPDIVGKMGMIVAFSGFASIFINSGFKSRIVQVEKINNSELNTIFVFNLFLGIIVTIILFFCSNLIATFFNYPELAYFIKIYSINFILQSLILVPLALNDRNLEFDKNTKAILVANILALILALILIFLNFDLMSLVIYSIAVNLFSIIFIYNSSNWRPKLYFRFRLLKSHLPYSMNLLFVRIFEEFVNRIDNIITGKYFDASNLGLFSKSKDIARLPNSFMTSTINNTLFPYFSRIQSDGDKSNSFFVDLRIIIAFIYINIFSIIIFFSKEVILILLSSDWLEMMTYFKIACFIMMIKGVSSFQGYFILSFGDSSKVSNSLYIAGVTKILLILSVIYLYNSFTPLYFLIIALISEILLLFIYSRKVKSILNSRFSLKNIKSLFTIILFLMLYGLIIYLDYRYEFEFWNKILLIVMVLFFNGLLIYFNHYSKILKLITVIKQK